MGPAVRAAAADARRQIERRIARSSAALPRRRSLRRHGRSSRLLEDGADPRQGRTRPEPGRDERAHLRRPGRRGRGRRRDRRGARSSASRRSTTSAGSINPLGASSQVEGGIIQGIGHTLSEQRLLDPATGRILTTTLDAYRMPTIADVPEIVCELVDLPDEQLTNLGSKGLGEPPIVPIAAAIANAIRDATGADVHELPISREEMLRALREARGACASAQRETAWSSCGRLASRSSTAGSVAARGRHRGRAAAAGGPARGRDARRRARRRAARRRRAHDRRRNDARGARGRAERSRTRCARPAGSRPRRSSATWARSAATCSSRRAAGTGGSATPAGSTAATRCHARDGEHREHAIFANDFCASAHPSDVAAALVALGATSAHEPARARRSRSSTGSRPRATGATTTLEPGELLLELELPPVEASRLPEGDGPQALGVPAGRRRRGAAAAARRGRARRRRAGALAARRARGARRSDAAAADGVEGRRSRGRSYAARSRRSGRNRRAGRVSPRGGASSRLRPRADSLEAAGPPPGASARRRSTRRDRASKLVRDRLGRRRASPTTSVVVSAPRRPSSTAPTGSAGPGVVAAQRPRPHSGRRREAAVVVLADGPDLDPRAVDRVVDDWRANGGDVVAASYGGVRLHPVLLARAALGRRARRGRGSLPARLVPCDDLAAARGRGRPET